MAASFDLRERDGTLIADIAGIAFDKSVTRRLNRPSTCEFRVPSDHALVNTVEADGHPSLCVGYRQISVELDGPGLFFHGIVWNLEDEGDEDMSYTKVTCYDPMRLWQHRPARDGAASGDAGDFTDPTFMKRNTTGPQMLEEILVQSEESGDIPADAEGPLFIDLANSSFATSGPDLSGAPTNWPMTIMDVANLLMSTGQVDVVIEPILGGANMAEVHVFNGNYGTDVSGSVNLDYATGDFNVRGFKRSESMDEMANKIWYYLGPRLDLQHWRASITGTHPDLSTAEYNPPQADIEDLYDDSRVDIGVMMDIKIFDQQGSEASAKDLYFHLWQVEALLRAVPRNMLYVTPVRGATVPVGSFDIGDLIMVNVGAKARKAQTGKQRIYAYTVVIDDDGVEELGQFECSPDQEI